VRLLVVIAWGQEQTCNARAVIVLCYRLYH